MNHNNRNTQMHFFKKINVKSVLTRIFILLSSTLLYSSFSSSAIFLNQSTNKLIRNSDLIIEGYVKEKHTNLEMTKINYIQVVDNKTLYSQAEVEQIITTFVLVVKNVYWGEYKQKEIEVKMEGGCYQEECVYFGYNYDYKLNENTVIFLNYDNDNKYYVSSSQAYSVFEIKDNKLKRKSENQNGNENLTINSLIKSIKEVKNENE